jgi:hypothetical protein
MKRPKLVKNNCRVCRKVIETEERSPKYFGGKGKQKMTCSDRCRQRYHRRQMKLGLKIPVTIGGNPKNLRRDELLAELLKMKQQKKDEQKPTILNSGSAS